MEYKEIHTLGVTLSRLGMGLMRLPTADGKIDDKASFAMVDALMAGGVNYYDAAFFYMDGQCEGFAGRALVDRYPRDSFYLTSKLPVNELKSAQDVRDTFEIQRTRLGVDCIDFYLLHGIDGKGWRHSQEIGAHEFQLEMKREGKIRFAGFSFHGTPEEMETILSEGQWDFAMMQINYFDWLREDAKAIYEAAVRHGVPLIAMEPVRGGGLSNLAPEAKAIASRLDTTPAATALRWVADLPGIYVVLSGMSTLEQVGENLALFSARQPLTDADRDTIAQVVEALDRVPTIACTGCNYCVDCPQGIAISTLFDGYNDYMRFSGSWVLEAMYPRLTPPERQVSACVECGACEQRCPQHLDIISELKRVHELSMSLAKA